METPALKTVPEDTDRELSRYESPSTDKLDREPKEPRPATDRSADVNKDPETDRLDPMAKDPATEQEPPTREGPKDEIEPETVILGPPTDTDPENVP